MLAATRALAPMATPPQPGTAVNEPARSMVSRMNRKLSIAWVCSETGSARAARMLRMVAIAAIIGEPLCVVKWHRYQSAPAADLSLGKETARVALPLERWATPDPAAAPFCVAHGCAP